MTIGVAWIAKRSDGREDLYLASDSRTRGNRVFDLSPKLLPLPRSDSALCFSGSATIAYPLMLQVSAAIAAHGPAKDRNMDIGELVAHLLAVLTDTASKITEEMDPFTAHDPEFIFAGYSWRAKDYRIWTISFDEKSKEFRARESANFHASLRKVAFTGDYARQFRGQLTKKLDDLVNQDDSYNLSMQPLKLLAHALRSRDKPPSIGGSPQVLRIGPHMNTRPLAVIWGSERQRYLYGRQLLSYENCDYWAIDPDSGESEPPKHFSPVLRTASKGA
jgi:hypothetical protein